MSWTTWNLRRSFAASDNKRDAGLTTPDDIERRDNICYGTDHKWQMLDVYRPKGTTGKLPVIVSIHGGGWTYGDKERYQWYCMNLAQRGFAVVNFTYRVAPEFKFPAGIEDTKLVFRWMSANPDWFDLSRVYAVGDSAGGHMLTIFSVLCTNPVYQAKIGITPPVRPDGSIFVPNAVGMNCAVFEIDIRSEHAHKSTIKLMQALLRHKGNDEELDLINPIPYINESFPPTYLMTANADPIAGPAARKAFLDRLNELHVEVKDAIYGDDAHPLYHVFHCNIRTEDADRCNADECRFFLSVK